MSNYTVKFYIKTIFLFKPEREALSQRPSASAKGLHPEGNNFFFEFLKQMAVAHSLFTLDGWVQLFWAAFDMHVTVAPFKVTLGYKKFVFWAF